MFLLLTSSIIIVYSVILFIDFYLHRRSSDHTVDSLLTVTSDADGHLCIAAT